MKILSVNAPAVIGRMGVILMMAAPTPIDALKQRKEELIAASDALATTADEAGRDLTEDELGQIEANRTEAENLVRQIQAREHLESARAGQGRRTVADPAVEARTTGARTVAATARVDQRTGGFRNLGDFAMNVYQAAAHDSETARGRLMAMNEGVGEDGGVLVPAEFREAIMTLVEGDDSLLPMTDGSTTARNAVTQNIDKTTPWGTAGINAYWEGEGQSPSYSGAKFDQQTLRLNKLFGLVKASDELLDDAPQLDNYLRVKTPEVMTQIINLAIVQGNGVGKPMGFMNSDALVTVAKELSQPADTIHHRNLVNMMGRMYAKSWPRSTWLMHQDVWAQLPLLSFRDVGAYPSTAAGTAFPIFVPPGVLAASPFGTLLGRPIMVLEAMETIGDLGDIALVDLKAYRTVTKAGGMRVDTSIHLKFDTDEMVFRFIFRLAGAPWWSAPVEARDGPNNRSPFVTLATR